MRFSPIGFSLRLVALTIASSMFLSACGGGGGGSSTANTSSSPYIAAMSDGIGLRSFTAGYSPYWDPIGTVVNATDNGNGSYTVASTAQSLSAGAWGALTSVSPLNFALSAATPATWVAGPSPSELTKSITMTLNGDGTVSVNDSVRGLITTTPVSVDLSGVTMSIGKTVAIPMPSGGTKNVVVGKVDSVTSQGYVTAPPGVISPGATYPAGSTSWISTGMVYPQDFYAVYNLTPATIPNSTPLSQASLSDLTIFTTSQPICTPYGRFVYSATQPSPTLYTRFDVYSGNTCAAIVTSGPTADALQGTVDVSTTTVRSQTIWKIENTYGSGSSFLDTPISGTAYAMKAFIAVVNNLIYVGYMTPAGTPADATVTNKGGVPNKIAMDAIMDAAALPRF